MADPIFSERSGARSRESTRHLPVLPRVRRRVAAVRSAEGSRFRPAEPDGGDRLDDVLVRRRGREGAEAPRALGSGRRQRLLPRPLVHADQHGRRAVRVPRHRARRNGAAARSGVEQIIANFGIALASTIAGIFLRVLLHQMRVDPGDVEGMTRIELADASKRVKAQLDEVSGNLALFQGQAAQRMNDVIASSGEAVNKTLTTFTHGGRRRHGGAAAEDRGSSS